MCTSVSIGVINGMPKSLFMLGKKSKKLEKSTLIIQAIITLACLHAHVCLCVYGDQIE